MDEVDWTRNLRQPAQKRFYKNVSTLCQTEDLDNLEVLESKCVCKGALMLTNQLCRTLNLWIWCNRIQKHNHNLTLEHKLPEQII